jgi:NADH-quinone oxidoreductase subunit J
LRKRKDTKGQVPSDQVRVKSTDRVKLVSMPADLDRKQTKSDTNSGRQA